MRLCLPEGRHDRLMGEWGRCELSRNSYVVVLRERDVSVGECGPLMGPTTVMACAMDLSLDSSVAVVLYRTRMSQGPT